MGARSFEQVGGFLAQQALGRVTAPVSSRIIQQLRALEEDVQKELLAVIPELLRALRSGKARQQGAQPALKRILTTAEAAQARVQDALNIIAGVRSLQALLEGGGGNLLVTAGGAALDQLVTDAPTNLDALLEGALKAAAATAPVTQAIALATSAEELVREVKLLWNSVLDLGVGFDFALLQDELVDQLEEALIALVNGLVDDGEAAAEAFLTQQIPLAAWFEGAT